MLNEIPGWIFVDFIKKEDIPDEVDHEFVAGVLKKCHEDFSQKPFTGIFAGKDGDQIFDKLTRQLENICDNILPIKELTLDDFIGVVGDDEELREIWFEHFGTNPIVGDQFQKLCDLLEEKIEKEPDEIRSLKIFDKLSELCRIHAASKREAEMGGPSLK